MITQEQLNDALLTVTGSREWEIVVKGLQNDIYQYQANILDAQSWEEVCEIKGFVRGLAYVINLRAATIAVLQAAKEDADAAV